jgi:hypothetical protein
MLLDTVVKVADDTTTQTIVRACTADYDVGVKAAFVPDEGKASLCTTANRVLEETSVYIHQPTAANDDEFSVEHLLSAGHQIHNHLSLQKPPCTNNTMEFAYSQSAAIGLFVGAELHQYGVTSDVLSKLLEYVQDKDVSKTTIVQLCGSNDRGADYSIGIVAASANNFPYIRKTVKTWADGGCASRMDAGEDWMKVTLRIPASVETNSNNGTNSTLTFNNTTPVHLGPRSRLSIRADCKTTTVQPGDGCSAVASRCGISLIDLEKYNRDNLCKTLIKDEELCCSSGTLPSTLPPGNSDGRCKLRTVVANDDCTSLASKCGISSADFMKANTKTNLCGTLAEGQQVCCTSGKRPNLKPKPDKDQNCATYLTKHDDGCSIIAVARDLTVNDLLKFNEQTWGWNGCKPEVFFPGFLMCVSEGTPPMPAAVPVRYFSSSTPLPHSLRTSC